MRKLFYTFLVFLFIIKFFVCSIRTRSSTAGDFTITDLDGNTHNLYDILDEGKPVQIRFVAESWCGPCWTFAETGVFDQFDELYGANGDNSAFTMAIESDENYTSISELTSETS